jgi:transposase
MTAIVAAAGRSRPGPKVYRAGAPAAGRGRQAVYEVRGDESWETSRSGTLRLPSLSPLRSAVEWDWRSVSRHDTSAGLPGSWVP